MYNRGYGSPCPHKIKRDMTKEEYIGRLIYLHIISEIAKKEDDEKSLNLIDEERTQLWKQIREEFGISDFMEIWEYVAEFSKGFRVI